MKEKESAVYFGLSEKFYVYSPFYRNGNQKHTNIIICVVEKTKILTINQWDHERGHILHVFSHVHTTKQKKTTACIYDLDLLPFWTLFVIPFLRKATKKSTSHIASKVEQSQTLSKTHLTRGVRGVTEMLIELSKNKILKLCIPVVTRLFMNLYNTHTHTQTS